MLRNPMSYVIVVFFCLFALFIYQKEKVPYVSIAYHGEKVSLAKSIKGVAVGLEKHNIKLGRDLRISMFDVSFDTKSIPTMLAKIKAGSPKIIIALGTAVAKEAVKEIKNVPLIFGCVTDPRSSGLLQEVNKAQEVTGIADIQDFSQFFRLTKILLPQAERIGILYNSREKNDVILVQKINEAATAVGITVVAISVDKVNELHDLMKNFKNNVDFIYTGISCTVGKALGTVIAEAKYLDIPIFVSDVGPVIAGQALGCFGVSYYSLGIKIADMIYEILQGTKASSIPILYPTHEDHKCYISRKQAAKFHLQISPHNPNLVLVDEKDDPQKFLG